MQRVTLPSRLATQTFEQAGMQDVEPHELTAAEAKEVRSVLAALPRLQQRVLVAKLSRLAFVDGIPGEGTGLTSKSDQAGKFDITLRASLLSETLTHFLTVKEKRSFSAQPGQDSVEVEGFGVSALHYVLLHESTHVVDSACHITQNPKSPFVKGIWQSPRALNPNVVSTDLARSYFRTGKPIPIADAPAIYNALASSPFVSLYSTAAAPEDLAELVAWREVQREHGNLVIRVVSNDGIVKQQWKPLTFPWVDKRFKQVDALLNSPRAYSSCEGGGIFTSKDPLGLENGHSRSNSRPS